MTPATLIAQLNRTIAQNGTDIQIARPAAPTTPGSYQVVVPARAYCPPMKSIGGGPGNLMIILSPDSLTDWDAQTGDSVGDPNLPRLTDKVIVKGRRRDIKVVRPYYVDDVQVRIELEVTS